MLEETKRHFSVWSEEDLRAAFVRLHIPEILGYEGDDVRYERAGVKGKKRTDLECFDDYRATRVVIEFKKPSDKKPLLTYEKKLWEDYVSPLRANYGVLYNGTELILFERVGANLSLKLHRKVEELTDAEARMVSDSLAKPVYRFEKLREVASYMRSHSAQQERRDLFGERVRSLFLEDFSLNDTSRFGKLLERTIQLFDHLYDESSFVSSAYDFWQRSYARKPEKVPSNWRPILKSLGMSTKSSDLDRFMFCLETAYALFTRLIVAKTAEDYEFPEVNLFTFLQADMQTREYKGEITAVGWGISLVGLMDRLRYDIVESIFEEDIFYWWTDPFKQMRKDNEEFLRLQHEAPLINFSLEIRDILLPLYMYDFSRIKGDPLGDLYQSYFDKDTRKALGEFYTPKEVVRFILDEIGYNGPLVTRKRLLDPATGSGTFIVEALKRYISASRAEGNDWRTVINGLVNDFRIVAFDIHPFATIMAQIQFVLELLPSYKKAIDEASARGERFRVRRLPIFRTDSLMDERKRKRADLTTFSDGIRDVRLNIPLPIRGSTDSDDFVEVNIRMPRLREVWKNTDLKEISQYFNALQASFDTVKFLAKRGSYDTDLELLKRNLMLYLENKDFDALARFFAPYCNGLLESIKELVYTFGDGRLVKSIEDVMLAGLLKNYVDYDFVVGNPPYIRIQKIPARQKNEWTEYKAAKGNYDIYVLFIERGLEWLAEGGKLGYITSNRFTKVNYGEGIRRVISDTANLVSYIDFRDTGIFKDALNYPAIFLLHKPAHRKPRTARICRVSKKPEHLGDDVLLGQIGKKIRELKGSRSYQKTDEFDVFGMSETQLNEDPWLMMPARERVVFDRLFPDTIPLHEISGSTKEESALSEGSSTGRKKVYVVEKLREYGNTTQVKSREDGHEYQMESEMLNPYVEDAGKWLPDAGRFLLIFPYEIKRQGSAELIPERELSEKYPLVHQYLCHHKGVLRSRKGFENRDDWYAYSAPRSLSLCFNRKLLVQGFSRRSSVSVDLEKKQAFGPDIYAMSIGDMTERVWRVVLGILNSDLTDFFVMQMGVVHGAGYYKFEDRFLRHLPIPKKALSRSKTTRVISDIVATLVDATRLQKIMDDFPDSFSGQFGETECREVVARIQENSLTVLCIDRTLDGLYAVRAGGQKEIDVLETEEEAQYLVLALHAALERGEKEARVLIPRNPSLVKAILKDFAKVKRKLSQIDCAFAGEELNRAVYELYALGSKDVDVIRTFLSRFG